VRIPSGVTDQVIYFVAVDATDLKTRETGLTSFTVYRARNGGAAVAYTTPTITEVDATNMPGVYSLLLDEDMTIGAGNDSEEVVLHITEAAMAPVTRTFELYRPKITMGNTLDVTAGGTAGINWGNIENPATVVDLAGTDINLVDTTTTNTDMRGTDNAALASVVTEARLAELDAANLPADIAAVKTDTAAILTDTADMQPKLGTPAGASISADIAAVKSDSAAILTDTADMQPKLGTPAADLAADIAAVKTDTGAILTDTADMQPKLGTPVTNLAADVAAVKSVVDANGTHLTDIKGATFDGATDSLEAIRDRGDAAWTTGAGGTPPQLLQSTTIATLTSQTVFTLTAGSADDSAYNNAVVVVTDQTTAEQKAVGKVASYVGSTKEVTLAADPGVFTMAVGDTVEIIAALGDAPTAVQVRQEIDANSTQLAKLGTPAVDLAADIAAVKSDSAAILTDTADMQPKLGTPATDLAADIAAVKSDSAAILVDTADMQPKLGTPAANIAADIAAVKTDTGAILTDTADMQPKLGTPAGTDISADIAAVKAETASILADTADMQPKLGTPAADVSADIAAVKAETASILADTADMQPKLGTPAGADLAADIAAIKADTAAILIDTNALQTDWADGGRLDLILDAILADTGTDGVVLTASERTAIADAILDRDMAAGTDSGSATVRTVRQALRASRNKVVIAGGTMTVYKENDATSSWTAAITTTAGDPVSAVDPA